MPANLTRTTASPDRHERRGVARSVRGKGGEFPMQPVVDIEGGHREVDPERRARVARRAGGGQGLEALDEGRPALRRDLEAGGPGVATVASEEVGALFQSGAEVQDAVAAAGGTDRVSELRADDGRSRPVVDESGRDEADDADRPRAADDRRRRVGLVPR